MIHLHFTKLFGRGLKSYFSSTFVDDFSNPVKKTVNNLEHFLQRSANKFGHQNSVGWNGRAWGALAPLSFCKSEDPHSEYHFANSEIKVKPIGFIGSLKKIQNLKVLLQVPFNQVFEITSSK